MSRTPWVSFDGKDCGGCKHLNERGYCEFTACIIPCTVAATVPATKPQTNADHIRSMTDEELAKWIAEIADHGGGKCAPGCYDCTNRCCEDAWLEWLKQEATS